MTIKPKTRAESIEVTYKLQHWAQLRKLRETATRIMSVLERSRLPTLLYGSIARGDVNKNTDIDVFIPKMQSSFLVETVLERARIPTCSRLLVQATPNYIMKAQIEIDTKTTISFPLMRMRRVEHEFYKFGGQLTLKKIEMDARILGVDKRLMMIEPTAKGHVESSIIGLEGAVAKRLGISVETVLDRVHALLKRNKVGRTGVFIKKNIDPDETFELALKKLADQNPAVRRRMQ